MKAVTVRDLRNNSAAVLARVGQGETLTVTKDGTPSPRSPRCRGSP
ncbi:type II toxin-antitoxin system Phd/YefM family antitoxin [Leucobacter soli]